VVEAVLVEDLLDERVAGEVIRVAALRSARAQGPAVAAESRFACAFSRGWCFRCFWRKVDFGELVLLLKFFRGRCR
jgi:hypothetical protein